MKSNLELLFDAHLRDAGLRDFVTEYRFDESRKWRFDFAWPGIKVAAECEGGIWSNGRHSRAHGFISDCDKYNAALLAGWKVYRFTAQHINSGCAVEIIRKALELGGKSDHAKTI